MVHRDNVPPHTSLLIWKSLAKMSTTVIPQHPDVTSADVFLFKPKSTSKGLRIYARGDEKILWGACGRYWNKSWRASCKNVRNIWKRCISSGGKYIKDDKCNWLVGEIHVHTYRYTRIAHNFQKSRSHLKFLGARKTTWRTFHTVDLQILGTGTGTGIGTTVQRWLTTAAWRSEIVQHWPTYTCIHTQTHMRNHTHVHT